jgi:hypothetical protein
MRLDPGDDLILNTHLQPSGKPETIQPTIGLYFTNQPATQFPVLLQLENDRVLDIPPGEKNFVVTDQFTLPEPVDVLAIYPHAHYLGREMFAFAKLPDGTTKTLLHIPRWDQNWQAVYHYVHAIPLPRGTTLEMRYIYDNSSDNIFNPNNPPKRVRAGNLATDEMAHLWLQVLPHRAAGETGDPRVVLLEALARHHVENNPGDFEAHYNLAAMLEAGGAPDQAIPEYEKALALRPGDATVEKLVPFLPDASSWGFSPAPRRPRGARPPPAPSRPSPGGWSCSRTGRPPGSPPGSDCPSGRGMSSAPSPGGAPRSASPMGASSPWPRTAGWP